MMKLYFEKYQGLGNDFILLDKDCCSDISLPSIKTIRKLCDRRLGIGADGLLFFEKADSVADVHMVYFNADGSRSETCFNGIRCIARHTQLTGIVDYDQDFIIATDSGDVRSVVLSDGNTVRCELAGASFEPRSVGIESEREWIESRLDFKDFSLTGTALSLGNPHFVVWESESNLDALNNRIVELGSRIEHSPHFREGINFELAVCKNDSTVLMAVWERGVGRTLACGSGATATVCAGVRTGRLRPDVPVTVIMAGGDITITCLSISNRVVVTGSAEHVFSGTIELESLA